MEDSIKMTEKKKKKKKNIIQNNDLLDSQQT